MGVPGVIEDIMSGTTAEKKRLRDAKIEELAGKGLNATQIGARVGMTVRATRVVLRAKRWRLAADGSGRWVR